MCRLWANASRREIVVVDGLSIHVPQGCRGGGGRLHRQTPNRLMQTPTHIHTHTCTASCLAWRLIEAGPNINYLFFSWGLVTVIRARVFWRVVHRRSNEENWPLYRALQAHLICFVVQQVCMRVCGGARMCGCDCRLAAGRETLWIWGLEADVILGVETFPKQEAKISVRLLVFNCRLLLPSIFFHGRGVLGFWETVGVTWLLVLVLLDVSLC